ncbi:hypothetical protein BDN72DRAFT_758251 [Pluteus cervinus]|uniref:Uncharacterized protein n=1 Tax=Pluteus cervinus TaxID=181527 RepID=A0ACD3BDK1_9AGAR|nr:hypothetical protein BDN72DRAFT_758251 [Pluteus cervinus]
MSSLRRTQSFLVLPSFIDLGPSSSASTSAPLRPSSPPQIPYNRSLRSYKDQRERRKESLTLNSSDPVSTASTSTSATSATTSTSSVSSAPTPKTQHTTSPLAPVRTAKPLCRPSFPRSKPEPDLYRRAITTRMRCSPEGQKILTMGPRLAVSIMTATRELEKIVAAQDCGRDYGRDLDLDSEDGGDIVMVDAADLISTPVTSPTTPMPASGGFLLSHPYAALPADAPLTSAWGMMKDDWEMVDCSA